MILSDTYFVESNVVFFSFQLVKDFGAQIDKYLKVKQAELIGGD